MKSVAFINVLDVREGADGCRTGKGAGFISAEEAKADFEGRKKALAVAKGFGDFLLDLHIDDDIVDTIEITTEGYRVVLGEEPKSVAENVAFDLADMKRAKAAAETL